jgi:excisionase family DNA binding protein
MDDTNTAAGPEPAAQPVGAAGAAGKSRATARMFLSAAEVGRELGIQKSRVYELAAGGLIPCVRLGRRVLFPRRGLEELAAAAIERARAACVA